MLRRDDLVIVITGKDKGKKGKILKVMSKESRVIVEKINIVKRHLAKGRSPKLPNGGILEKEAPIHMSNVLLYNEKYGRGVRHDFKEKK